MGFWYWYFVAGFVFWAFTFWMFSETIYDDAREKGHGPAVGIWAMVFSIVTWPYWAMCLGILIIQWRLGRDD